MDKKKMSTGKLVSMTLLAFVICIAAAILLVSSMDNQPEQDGADAAVQEIDFATMYNAYKENELRAEDTYQGNRYLVTAVINGMTNDGVFNMAGGATLTMQTQVDNTTVFFHAEFEKDQEEALKAVNVGDTITFEGECWDGNWSNCKLVEGS